MLRVSGARSALGIEVDTVRQLADNPVSPDLQSRTLCFADLQSAHCCQVRIANPREN